MQPLARPLLRIGLRLRKLLMRALDEVARGDAPMTLTIEVLPDAWRPTMHISAFLEKSKEENQDSIDENKDDMVRVRR
jgi:hypothetical protein